MATTEAAIVANRFGFGARPVGGAFWRPLLLTAPLLVLAIVAPVTQAALGAAAPAGHERDGRWWQRLGRYALTAWLHLLQPLARFWGRLREGLTPWRRRIRGIAVPRPRFASMWSEQWRSYDAWLHAIEGALQARRARIRRGGDYDRWDLEVRGGMFGAVRALATVEEHGQGRQFTRVRAWPRLTSAAAGLMIPLNVLAIEAVHDGQPQAGAALGLAWATVAWRTLFECANAMCAVVRALDDIGMERDHRGSR